MTLTESNIDGSEPETKLTKEGYGYCVTISPDGIHAAYHITGTPGQNSYEIYVIDLSTGEEDLLASDPDYLNFGPEWSPDGEWVLYQRCAFRQDPGHERSDLRITRRDASEHRMLTSGRTHWFATSYGSPETRGGGSNMPKWSPDGRNVTYTRLLPGSRTAWQYKVGLPDRDHFNRDYRPDEAQGGTEIYTIDPETGETRALTQDDPPIWNWRTEWSPDSKRMLFSRAAVGHPSEVWIMDLRDCGMQFITRGCRSTGADFARFANRPPGRI
jgi:TolB protein